MEMSKACAFFKVPFVCLKQLNFGVSPLKLINCDGGFGYGIDFDSSSVLVDYVEHYDPEQNSWINVYAFTEIFAMGNVLLMDFIELGKMPTERMQLKVLETLFTFTSKLKDVEQGLQITEEMELAESEWMARVTVHYLSQLSVAQDYMLDSKCRKKVTKCPCPCQRILNYGDTLIGNPHTWYGQIDVLLGHIEDENRDTESQGHGAEVAISVILEEARPPRETSLLDDTLSDSDSFSDSSDGSSHVEEKHSPLDSQMSKLHSQTIVFSFYQKKCHPDLNIIPFIGVSKTHIQFHFYDSEKDIYLLSREMPVFYSDKTLNISTVLATWLVVNYKCLITGVTQKMNEEKFGFHSFVGPHNFHYFKDKIEMGPLKTEPVKFCDDILTGKRFLPHSDVTAEIDAKYARKS